LAKAPTRVDIRSIWVGLRPLVKPPDEEGESTKALSREHTVLVSRSGLVTVTGGKWTTYRAMAEDVLDHCFRNKMLGEPRMKVTANLKLVGAPLDGVSLAVSAPPGPHLYGSEQALLESLPGAAVKLGGGLTEAMVRFAARYEYARTVEDVLARRSRLLFLDAALARRLAPRVAQILASEIEADPQTAAFEALAGRYLPDLEYDT